MTTATCTALGLVAIGVTYELGHELVLEAWLADLMLPYRTLLCVIDEQSQCPAFTSPTA